MCAHLVVKALGGKRVGPHQNELHLGKNLRHRGVGHHGHRNLVFQQFFGGSAPLQAGERLGAKHLEGLQPKQGVHHRRAPGVHENAAFAGEEFGCAFHNALSLRFQEPFQFVQGLFQGLEVFSFVPQKIQVVGQTEQGSHGGPGRGQFQRERPEPDVPLVFRQRIQFFDERPGRAQAEPQDLRSPQGAVILYPLEQVVGAHAAIIQPCGWKS